ncbi:MAG: phosphatase PAP2 family protein [Chloroflexota bacterium]|nr:phosphatase PAP2 family protein [Chloroflexota bacterium]
MAERLAPAIGRTVRFINKIGLVELFLIAVAFVFYYMVRGVVAERTVEATSRAIRIVELEQRLGFFWEAQMQAWVMSSNLLVHLFNNIYVYAHFPIIVGIGLWLFFFHRQRYVVLRNAFLISGGIGLIIFNLLPTAPPRLLPWPLSDQVVDTMWAFSKVNYDMQPAAFVNRYAAMPSLHFGWNLLLGIGVFWTARHFLGKAFGVIMPAAMLLAVVVTGNHFILDVLAGTVVALIGLGLALLLQHRGHRLWRLLLPDRIFRHLARSSGA